MPIGVNVDLPPFPLSGVLCSEVLLEMGKCLSPSLSHGLLLGCISSVRKVDVVEDALLHVVEGNQTHLFRVERLHQMVQLKHKHFIDCSSSAH